MNLRSHAPEACALAGLSYILKIGAHDEDRTRLPGSTVRSLRQMGTWAIWCARPGSNRHGLPPPSQDGASTSFATSANLILEDLVGLEPTVTCVDGLRIRSLGRWGHRSMMEDPGGFEPLAHGLKVRSISIQV